MLKYLSDPDEYRPKIIESGPGMTSEEEKREEEHMQNDYNIYICHLQKHVLCNFCHDIIWHSIFYAKTCHDRFVHNLCESMYIHMLAYIKVCENMS